MHLADTFIQSDLQLDSGYTISLVSVFPGNQTHNLLRCWRIALPLSHTQTRMDGYLLKLKCKYSNILRYWIFDFH